MAFAICGTTLHTGAGTPVGGQYNQNLTHSDKVDLQLPVMVYEDFAYFQKEIPGMFIFLGARPPAVPEDQAAPNHSPYFVIDEAALKLGVSALANLALDFLFEQ